jgi:hypothetical protein
MPALRTTFVERLTLKPGLVERQPVARQLGFALLLFDAFTRQNRLVGVYEQDGAEMDDQNYADRTGDVSLLRAHTTVRLSGRLLVPFRKAPASTYLFFADLPPGAYTVTVRSPFYLARDIVLQLPMPIAWPGFPDATLANEDLPLDSPLQPAAYRAQRQAATLIPSTKYPFSQEATLVRGTVRAGGQPLAGALVKRSGDDLEYLTDDAGDYVLFLDDVPGVGVGVTIEATHPQHPPASESVQALRGMTVLRDIAMA